MHGWMQDRLHPRIKQYGYAPAGPLMAALITQAQTGGTMRYLILGLTLGLLAGVASVAGQEIPQSLQAGGSDDVVRQRVNQWTVGIAAGPRDSISLHLADELARALDDGDQLRVLPIISRDAASDVEDLLYVRGVDIAFTQSDVLEYFRTQRKTPNLANKIQYVARLPLAQLHVAARDDIHRLEDLRGRKVAFGSNDASAITGPIVFERLGIPIEARFADFPTGLKMLASGEIAAFLGEATKPIDIWSKIPPDAGLHLLPVPNSTAFGGFYVAAEFTSTDYPNLVPPGQRIDTIAVPLVIAVQYSPKNDDSFRRIERFTQHLFARWDMLLQPPFDSRWRDVDLATRVPGWTMFSTSEAFQQVVRWREQRPR
jgi:TRAP-type uncharacterized transport system substrate-binding protein